MPAHLPDELALAESLDDALSRLNLLMADGPDDDAADEDPGLARSDEASADVPEDHSVDDDPEEERIAW
jgi:hypothetical protein